MSDYDQFEKIFCGTWKHDRDENLAEFMDHLKYCEEEKQMSIVMKPTLIWTRKGDAMEQTFEFASGVGVTNSIKFGQEYEMKDKTEPKKFHNTKMPTFDGTRYKEVTKSLMPPPKNIDFEHSCIVQGDQLIIECSGIGDYSVIGKRFFKRA